jgi:hypothetical protein
MPCKNKRAKGKVHGVAESIAMRSGRIDHYYSVGTGKSRETLHRVIAGDIQLPEGVSLVRRNDGKMNYTSGSRHILIGVRNYATDVPADKNRRSFRNWLAKHPHVRVKKEAYRDAKDGEVLLYKDGTACMVPSPVQIIGGWDAKAEAYKDEMSEGIFRQYVKGLHMFVLGGVTADDVRELRSRLKVDVGWLDSVEEIQTAPPSSGTNQHAKLDRFGRERLFATKKKARNPLSDGIPAMDVIQSRKNPDDPGYTGVPYIPPMRKAKPPLQSTTKSTVLPPEVVGRLSSNACGAVDKTYARRSFGNNTMLPKTKSQYGGCAVAFAGPGPVEPDPDKWPSRR